MRSGCGSGRAVNGGLFLLQLPPPVHGVTAMNARVLECASRVLDGRVDVLRIAFAEDLGSINRVSARKLWLWLRLLLGLATRLARRRPSFVYFTPVPTGPGFLRDLTFIGVVKAFRVPLILHLHGRGIAERTENPLWRGLYRLVLRQCAIVSASPGMQARELTPLRLSGSRLYTVPNRVEAVDVEGFRRRCSGRAPRLLFLSSTFPAKGVLILLDAAKRLRERGVPFELNIVGSSTPAIDGAIAEYVRAHDLGAHVRCDGALYGPDKYRAFGRADVFVHPTLNDYVPLVVLEALQFGLPIVSTNVGAIPEMVIDGEHGLIVEQGDAAALACALETLLRDAALRRSMGLASRCRYLTHYAPERFDEAFRVMLRAERFAGADA